ncbi:MULTISPECIES: glycosyltransferase [unclassified Pseudomonas]|uniref:glycosyltransferase n=1 Tax=unclassified Pseudomonas TaxID=196821 RepID=UPI000EAAA3C3|nr:MULTISPECIES: glycosyltransferase [unclassified Pseudomonas]AYF87487.1 glycosyltransferase [Pseudomonas sp. DY-1]MDH4656628.1 glycosyltransferase [Pseudomonas sp. BN606]MRK23026.1 glycosyltransferase [Pseudomonas sp. JG-B]
MHKSRLLSIVIPTHNRSRYAVECVKSILEIDSDEFEVVIHDTSNDGCELRAWAAGVPDDRLRYVHWGEPLSMTQNHEHAIALACGEYVCLIGDDDSVSSQIIAAAKFADGMGIDILTPEIKAMYSWPDFKTSFYGSAHAGKLYLGKISRQLLKKDSAQALRMSLDNACQGTDGLPKLYHGLVRRALLDKLRESTGLVFYGTSPDISVSLGLALLSSHFYVVDFPFTIPGASGGSNTGRSAVNKHKGDIKSDPHMQPFKNLDWPKELPFFFSVETVWGHSAWETLKLRAPELLADFNLNRFFAVCKSRHSDYREAIGAAEAYLSSVTGRRYSPGAVKQARLKFFFERLVGRAKRMLHPLPNNGMEAHGPYENVRYAKHMLEQLLGDDPMFKR